MFFTRPDDTTAHKKFKSTLSGRCADLIFPKAVGFLRQREKHHQERQSLRRWLPCPSCARFPGGMACWMKNTPTGGNCPIRAAPA